FIQKSLDECTMTHNQYFLTLMLCTDIFNKRESSGNNTFMRFKSDIQFSPVSAPFLNPFFFCRSFNESAASFTEPGIQIHFSLKFNVQDFRSLLSSQQITGIQNIPFTGFDSFGK